MIELIEDDTWVPLDISFTFEEANALASAAIRNGRTVSEEFVHQMTVKKRMLRPPRTH
jgi:hypothetical protein